MTAANEGLTRVPGGGRLLSGALVRTVIQPTPALLGSVNGPRKVAPACSVITSPGCAALSAAWKSPPAGTVMVWPDGGTSVVSRNARGSSRGCASELATIAVGGSSRPIANPPTGRKASARRTLAPAPECIVVSFRAEYPMFPGAASVPSLYLGGFPSSGRQRISTGGGKERLVKVSCHRNLEIPGA